MNWGNSLRLYWPVGLFIVLFLLSLLAGFIQFWILGEMTEQVNRKRGPGRELDPFVLSLSRASWYQVLREYRSLYPTGRLRQLFRIAIGTTIFCAMGLVFLLFGVFPTWALPSR